jgi:hypothetical protein
VPTARSRLPRKIHSTALTATAAESIVMRRQASLDLSTTIHFSVVGENLFAIEEAPLFLEPPIVRSVLFQRSSFASREILPLRRHYTALGLIKSPGLTCAQAGPTSTLWRATNAEIITAATDNFFILLPLLSI